MRLKRMITVACVLAVAVSVGAGSAAAAAPTKFEGKVLSKNANKRTFRLMQDEGGGTFTFKVTDTTQFQRIAGFGAIKPGATGIEVKARKSANGAWIAITVERSGKSGGGGGSGGGHDDRPNHT